MTKREKNRVGGFLIQIFFLHRNISPSRKFPIHQIFPEWGKNRESVIFCRKKSFSRDVLKNLPPPLLQLRQTFH